MWNSGLGNKSSSLVEADINKEVIENYAKRAQKLGKFPGTHSLGKEFETIKKQD